MNPYVLATSKDTLVDKAWTRFRELITRHLLGLNAHVAANNQFESLDAYGILKFAQPIIPTNCTDVLREGYDALDDVQELEIRRAAQLQVVAENAMAYREDHRDRSTCYRCGSTGSSMWHPDPISSNEYNCKRCARLYFTYGRFQTGAELADRHARDTDLASRPPAPGWCENELCAVQESAQWHLSKAMDIYLCSACARYSTGANSNKLRCPPANVEAMAVRRNLRDQRECPGYCENPQCGSTKSGF